MSPDWRMPVSSPGERRHNQLRLSALEHAMTPVASRVRDADLQWVTAASHGGLGRTATTVMKDLPLSKVYQLLEPGPVVLLTTALKGHSNVMAMSWHMMVEFEPPLVACVVSSANYSFAALRATKECVIAVPALELAPKVAEAGNCSGR